MVFRLVIAQPPSKSVRTTYLKWITFKYVYLLKNMLHGILLKIKIYSPEVNNVQRLEAELTVISQWINKSDIQQKSMQHLLYYILLLNP